MKLKGLIGNEPLKRALAGTDRPSHAVIISGPKGSGRHTLARLLAQALVCDGAGEVPCGQCAHCRRVREGIHPDVMGLASFMSPGDFGKDVKVGVIRDIRADAQIRPNQARRKVYLIDQPINLAAQNAMLKLLEEGPSYAAFLIITENSAALLETVRSRCALLHTCPVTPAQAMEYLTRRYPDKELETLSEAVEGCQGLLGRAVDILEGEEKTDDTEAVTALWLEALLRRSELELMRCAAAVQTKKLNRDSAEGLYAALGKSFRDGLVKPVTGESGGGSALVQSLARTFTADQLLRLHDLAEEAREQCSFHVAPGHSAGWLAVKFYETVCHI